MNCRTFIGIYRIYIPHLRALIPVLAVKEEEPEFRTVMLSFIKLGGKQVRRGFRKVPERPTDSLFRHAQMIEAMAPEERKKINKDAKELLDKVTGTEPQPGHEQGQNNVQPLRATA
jgi:hypothetical protein